MTFAPRRLACVVMLAALVAAGVAMALAAAAAQDGYLVPSLIRAWAPWIPGPLARLGVPVSLNGFFAEAAAMTLAYAAVVVLAPRIRLRWIFLAVVALNVVFLLAPPMLSTDVFNYVDVARLMGRYHLDPYTSPPLAERHDSLYVFLHWRHAVTVYGPLFTLPSRLLGRLPAVDAVWAFKAAAAAAAVGCSALVGWIARQRRVPTGRAVAAFGLNPVLLVWTVGGAHNDLLMLLLLLAGTALVLAARPVAGGALAVAAAAIKLSGGLAVPFLVLGAGRGRRLRTLVGAVGAVAVIAALTAAAFPDHAAGMITQLQRQQALVGLASVPLSLAYALGLPTVTPTELHVLHALLAVWLAGCVVAVLRGGDVLSIVGWAFLGVIVASTFMLPWYAVWPLAFAAAAGNWRLLVATCVVAACWIVGHIPVI